VSGNGYEKYFWRAGRTWCAERLPLEVFLNSKSTRNAMTSMPTKSNRRRLRCAARIGVREGLSRRHAVARGIEPCRCPRDRRR